MPRPIRGAGGALGPPPSAILAHGLADATWVRPFAEPDAHPDGQPTLSLPSALAWQTCRGYPHPAPCESADALARLLHLRARDLDGPPAAVGAQAIRPHSIRRLAAPTNGVRAARPEAIPA